MLDIAPKLEALTAAFVKEHRIPGVAAGVVHGADLVWSAGVGHADIASARPAAPDVLYRIASITKTFTGTAIMQLRDRGLLHLDDPAVTYLPELRDASSPFGAIETVTLRRLLSHESGFMGDPPGTDWATPTYEGEAARNLERVAEMGTKIPPNAQQKYSNIGYQLLGEIVARVSGTPYPMYVREAILDPLGMGSSAFPPLPAELDPRCATGYSGRFLSDELDLASIPPEVWAEGGMWSCVDDLARWISAQLGDDETVLANATRKEMHTPRYLGDDTWEEAWCISWYAVRKGDVVWVQHSGGIHGFDTNVCFDPKEKVGAIVLVNGLADTAGLAMTLAGAAREAVREAVPAIDPVAPMPEAYRSLLGVYVQYELGQLIRVEWRDKVLMVVNPDEATWRPRLMPTDDPDVFLVELGVRESGEHVTFNRLPDGRVASVLLAADRFVRLDPVEMS